MRSSYSFAFRPPPFFALAQLYQKKAGSEFLGGVDIGDPASTVTQKQYRGRGGAVFDGICITGLDGDVHSEAAGEVREIRTFNLRVPVKSPADVEGVYDQLIKAQLRLRTVAAMKDTFARFALASPTTGEEPAPQEAEVLSAFDASGFENPTDSCDNLDAGDDAAQQRLHALAGGATPLASSPALPPLPEGEPPARRILIIDGGAATAPGAPKSSPPTPKSSPPTPRASLPAKEAHHHPSTDASAKTPTEAPADAPADARHSAQAPRAERTSRGPAPGPPATAPPELPWKPLRGRGNSVSASLGPSTMGGSTPSASTSEDPTAPLATVNAITPARAAPPLTTQASPFERMIATGPAASPARECAACSVALPRGVVYHKEGLVFHTTCTCQPHDRLLRLIARSSSDHLCPSCSPPGALCVDCKTDLASGEVEASLDATNGDLLCIPCDKRRRGEICASCDVPLLGEYVTALGGTYCHGCLTCSDCSLDLTSGEAQLTSDAATGDVLCVPCSKRRLGEICTTCDDPLLGKYVNVLDGKYHHGCLKCSACALDLTTRTAQPTRDAETGDVLCTPCSKRRLGEICTTCDEPLLDEYVTALNGKYHHGCLKCSACELDLTTETAQPTRDAETGDVLCTPCSKRRLGEICTCRYYSAAIATSTTTTISTSL